MAINYASSYSKNAVQAFTIASLTRGALSGRADFVADSGKSVKVFTNGTAAMNDYSRTGSNRFGTPTDLDNTVQEMTCTRERAFSTVLDGVNAIDQGATAEAAGAFLRRQIDEVITPEIDIWTLSKVAAGAASGNVITGALTTANAYSVFLDLNGKLDDAKTPMDGRRAYVSTNAYKLLKQCDGFVKSGDLSQDMLVKGQIGEVDGVAIIKTPTSYMPANTEIIIVHKDAACQPIRLEQYNIYDKVQGYSGPVVEGLVYYDAFVYDARKGSIAVAKSA